MRKIVCIIICFAFIYAEKIEVVTDCNVRSTPKNAGQTNIIGQVKKGEVFDVSATRCDYYKVKVVGKSKLTNTIAWVWVEAVSSNAINGKGATLRSAPAVGQNIVGTVGPGAVIEVLERNIIWYNIGKGWVGASFVKPLKE